jgi:hypothetical protein
LVGSPPPSTAALAGLAVDLEKHGLGVRQQELGKEQREAGRSAVAWMDTPFGRTMSGSIAGSHSSGAPRFFMCTIRWRYGEAAIPNSPPEAARS